MTERVSTSMKCMELSSRQDGTSPHWQHRIGLGLINSRNSSSIGARVPADVLTRHMATPCGLLIAS